MRNLIIGIAMAVTAVVVGCEDDDGITGRPPELDTLASVNSPCVDADAETIALTLSKKLLAPQWLYDRVHADLTTIREQWGDSSLFVDIHHHADPGEFFVRTDPIALNLADSASRYKFDSLCEFFGLEAVYVDTARSRAYVRSPQRYYPRELMIPFTAISGVLSLENGGHAGDWPDLYVLRQGPDIKYFFMGAWGDCYSGCIFHQWTYIISEDGKCRHIATTPVYPGSEWPDFAWLDTLNIAACEKIEYTGWHWERGWSTWAMYCDFFGGLD